LVTGEDGEEKGVTPQVRRRRRNGNRGREGV